MYPRLKLLQIAPENAGNRISEVQKLKSFRGSMPPDPLRGYRLLRGFNRTPLRQILDPPQDKHDETYLLAKFKESP